MALMRHEQETHLNMVASDRSTWQVYTDDPVWMRKLEDAQAEWVRDEGEGKHYRLKGNQIRLFKPITRDQSQILSSRLQNPPQGRVFED